jgi:NAD(P)-dependent dehydrogenase (short-subunit alcohol dehydrogenase family)
VRGAQVLDAVLEASVAGSFSRIGYEVRSRTAGWTPYDLSGLRILITGGTSGLGLAAAQYAVAQGATVAITGRSENRLADAAGRIGNVRTLVSDAADLEAASGLVADAAEALGGLDVLVHNAGALDKEFHRSPQGFERTYAVHVLSPFLITAHALPLVQRVVTVSSGGMYTQTLDPEHLQMRPEDYDGVTAYARAKRAQVALNAEWARRYPAGPVFSAMHPGWADTPGVQRSLPAFRRITGPILRTPSQGADTMLWLAATDVPSGRFWLDRRERDTMRLPWHAYDQAAVERTWDLVAEQSGAHALVG